MADPRICRKCVLPENGVEISLDGEGVCNLCREHERRRAAGPASADAPLETDFIRAIDQYRGKGEFDCLEVISHCSTGRCELL